MIKLIATWNNQRLDLESPTSTTAEQVHQLVSRLLNTTLRHCGENMFFTWAILEGMAATLARFGWEDREGMEIEMNSRDSLQTSLEKVQRRIGLAFTWRWVTAYLTTDQQLRSRPQWSVFIIITSLQHPSVYTRTIYQARRTFSSANWGRSASTHLESRWSWWERWSVIFQLGTFMTTRLMSVTYR